MRNPLNLAAGVAKPNRWHCTGAEGILSANFTEQKCPSVLRIP
jgi:hypothetical protein